MKKICTLIALVLTFVMMFNVVPVYAADGSKDAVWEDFITRYESKYKDIVQSNSDSTQVKTSLDSTANSMIVNTIISHGDYVESNVSVTFTYSNGIISIETEDRDDISYESIEDAYVRLAIKVLAEKFNYDYSNVMRYMFSNTDFGYLIDDEGSCTDEYFSENNFTIQSDGIEFEMKPILACGMGFSSEEDEETEYAPYASFKVLKFDYVNGLKTYDNDYTYTLDGYGDVGYEFIEGANQKYDSSKDNVLRFRIDAEFLLFDKVYIDEKLVDSSNYTASEGSTIIEFKSDYAKKLSTGIHTLKVTFLDGEKVTTQFTVVQGTTNPKTGNEFGYKELLVVVALGGLAITMLRSKKKRYN